MDSLSGFSSIIVGCWRLNQWDMSRQQLAFFVDQAVEIGLTSFDHADIYGDYTCEDLFGQALAPSVRDQIQLISKCGIRLLSEKHPHHSIKHYDTSAEHIVASVENSLRNLRTDRLDMLLLHRPDPLLDADEVAEVFDRLRRDGKVLSFGVSNFNAEQFEMLASRTPLVANQIEVSPLHVQPMFDGTLDTMQKVRVHPMAWSPFGGGRLFTGTDEQSARVRSTLEKIAREKSSRVDVVALSWIMKHPAGILPVVGTGRIDRLEAYTQASADHLSRQEWFDILKASTGTDVP